MPTQILAYLHTHIPICTRIYLFAHAYTYLHTHIPICTRIYLSTYIRSNVCITAVRVYTHILFKTSCMYVYNKRYYCYIMISIYCIKSIYFEGSEFKFQLCYYNQFRTNTLGKSVRPCIPLHGLKSIAGALQRSLWH